MLAAELARISERVARHSVGDGSCEFVGVSLVRDLVAIIDRCTMELVPHVLGRIEIGEPVIGARPHPLKTHIDRRQQHRVVQSSQLCSSEKRRQEPRADDPVIDHIAVTRQPPRSGCCRFDNSSVLVMRRRQPRINLANTQKAEEVIASD
jgi:hypothetical protein